jgi:N-methylhydantoinase A/oxoprolinase/acetone carboxylase beta subunit
MAVGRDVADRFHRAHHARHGHANAEAPVECVLLRVAALGGTAAAIADGASGPRAEAQPVGRRHVVFDGRATPIDIYRREDLPQGIELGGP